MIPWARALRALSLGIWLGGILATFLFANTVFTYFDRDRTSAGEIVGLVLRRAAPLQIGLGLFSLALQAALFLSKDPNAPKGWRRFVPAATLMLALAGTLFASLWLGPQIEALRDQIGVFNAANADSPLRKKFGALHGASMALSLLIAILLAISLVSGLL